MVASMLLLSNMPNFGHFDPKMPPLTSMWTPFDKFRDENIKSSPLLTF